MYSGPFQISAIEIFAKAVNKMNLKPLTGFAKSCISDACQGSEYVSGGGYNTGLKIYTEISPWRQVKLVSF